MGTVYIMFKTVALLLTLTLSFSAMADITLVYQGNNHWVSKGDNAPLQKLVAMAKIGQQN